MQTVDGGLRVNGGLRVFVTWKEATQRNIPGRKVLHEISKKKVFTGSRSYRVW